MAYSKMGHVVRQQPSITEHGEVIIMEATCHAEHLVTDLTVRCCFVASYMAFATAIATNGVCGICWFAAVPIAWCCGKRVAKSWTLQLTETAVHHRRKHGCYLCTSADTNVRIDLEDIETITVEQTRVNKHCFQGVEKHPTTVCLRLKPGRRHDLLPHDCSCRESVGILECTNTAGARSILVMFPHCQNAEEFVEKVKQQKQSNALY
jgi:hypothetical protein